MYGNFQIFMLSREIIVKKIKSSTKNYLKKKIACQKIYFLKIYIITTTEILTCERLAHNKSLCIFFI